MTDWTDIKIPNGEHKGKTVEEVPSRYLTYIAENWKEDDIVCAAEKELAFREKHGTHWNEDKTNDPD